MLGKTAGGLMWMFRYLERSENTTRLIEAGFRIALTSPSSSDDEWVAVIETAGVRDAYAARHDGYDQADVIDFLLRDPENPSSVMQALDGARMNARLVRTALSREVWEAVNEGWIETKKSLARPVRDRDLPDVLGQIRKHNALVRGALHGTMLRNDIFNFSRLGTFVERADNTARILDVKFYVLLPTVGQIGSTLDNIQWETVLRCVGGQRSYRWLFGGDATPAGITDFLILDSRMPRSLLFCINQIRTNLGHLEREYGTRHTCHDRADRLLAQLTASTTDSVFDVGLHEFILEFLEELACLASEIETDYRFYG